MIGTKLAHFQITAHLGSGGMGDVYQATDSKLGRSVAIKLLPEAFARDSERVARFEREARVLASLNHPNIAAIHGFERVDGRMFLVMEYVPGETLAERIYKGSVPLDEALGIAKQICEGLEAAHEKGIVHRDLKPANVKITPEGRVKVLDFGLAKAYQPEAAGNADPSNSPTLMSAPSMPGVILGTAAYMSPEQAKGKEVDKRTDIFAFGCVLYEMLTGKRAFDGEDVSEILSAVIRGEPDWTLLPPETSAAVRNLLRLCLEKNANNRRSTAIDVRIDIDSAQRTPASGETSNPVPPKPNAKLAWVAALLTLACISLAVPYLTQKPPAEMRVDIATPMTATPLQFALSPDGQSIAFAASGAGAPRLWVRRLDRDDAQALPGTEGATHPFWSPDSKSIGFFANGKLKRTDAAGGAVIVLANGFAATGAAWNSDGMILYRETASGSSFQRIAASGGEPIDFDLHQTSGIPRFPEFLPDGHRFLYYLQSAPDAAGIYLASIDGGTPKRLGPADSAARWLPPDRILYGQQGRLVARRLDLSRQELTGDAETIADSAGTDVSLQGGFSDSANGRLAYRSAEDSGVQLEWLDRSGKPTGKPLTADQVNVTSFEISPDGKRLAIDRVVEGNRDVWLTDLVRGGMTRFTYDPAADGYPVWFPDGERIAFESQGNSGDFHIYTKASDGSGEQQLLFEAPGGQWPEDISRDGKFLLYYDRANSGDQLALPLTGGERKPIPIATTKFEEHWGAFSPNSKWVAYDTRESGRFEVMVQAFPTPQGRWQVSTGGGSLPRWSADGKEIYFISPDSKLMAVAVHESGASIEAESPAVLFALPPFSLSTRPPYAISREGNFLVNKLIGSSSNSPIKLILNWHPEQKK